MIRPEEGFEQLWRDPFTKLLYRSPELALRASTFRGGSMAADTNVPSLADDTMKLETKADKLSQFIAEKARELGLKFVNGPNNTATTPPTPRPNVASGQKRMGLFFSVAEE